MIRFFLGSLVIATLGCTPTNVNQEITTLRSELIKAQEQIAALNSQIEPEGELIHMVFFKVKENADTVAFVNELKKLSTIEEVLDFQVGPFEDLGDPRALSEFNWMMEMSFTDIAAYKDYQKHPTHLALRTKTSSFMIGPPSTYDYLKK